MPPAITRPPPKLDTSRGLVRQHADVLVLGHSLEGALTATLLAKRGWKVLWPGLPPAVKVAVGTDLVHAAPGLMPSLTHAPGLSRALSEVGLLQDVQKLLRPVDVQLLDDRLRLSLPAAEVAKLSGLAGELDLLSEDVLKLGYIARRAQVRRRALAESRLELPTGLAGTLVEGLDTVLATTASRGPVVQLASAPHQLPGGLYALVSLLHKRFLELGGWSIAHGLEAPLEALETGWSSVRCLLAGGDELSARLLVLALDDGERARLLPETQVKLGARLGSPTSRPLVRMSLVVHARGLPAPLGPAALVGGKLLLERRALTGGRDELAVYWRRGEASVEAEAEDAFARLRSVLPFFERHVVARAAPVRLPYLDHVEAPRMTRPAWRALLALAPQAGVGGADGAGLLAAALTARATRLAPRRDLLK